MDWKEALLAKSREMGIEPEPAQPAPDTESEPEPEPEPAFDPAGHPALHVVVERKGRGGKTATIIEGFTCPEATLRQVAASLKSALGTGGSARGGEILIQGDCRDRVRDSLKKMGFKLKG